MRSHLDTTELNHFGGSPSAKPVTPEWRRWVAENVLLSKEPASIVAAMVRDGIQPDTALAEVRIAMHHPFVEAARRLLQSSAAGSSLEPKLKKREWVLECLRRAARQASCHGAIPRVRTPSRKMFLDEYYALNRPVVIEGAMDDWPALTRWTLPALKERFGGRIVEVQASRSSDPNYERNQDKLRKTMLFSEYIDTVESAGTTNDWYMTANNSGRNKEALPELWQDVVQFPEYLRTDDPRNLGFFWFGPAGTVTPLHHDLTNNFMAQVRGRKLIRLIAPYELNRLYNDRHCYSPVDLHKPDLGRFPLFKDVSVVDATIGPGEVLFLPVGWWHYVRSLDISITMTFTNFVFDNDFYSFYSTYSEI